MQIIPVMDLKSGQVVHGRAGNRALYQPLRSILAENASPLAVARGLADQFGRCPVYIADLDAMGGAEPDWASYRAVLQHHASCWIDAGVSHHQQALTLLKSLHEHASQVRVIIGLETIAGFDEIRRITADHGPDRCGFSLDLRAGVPWARSEHWRNRSAEQIADEVIASGIHRIIVLDVARVGMDNGTGTSDLCRELSHRHPHVEWIAGGGITGLTEIRSLHAAGCQGVLMASALHDGRITRQEFEQVAAWY